MLMLMLYVKQGYKVVVDCINSTGAIAMPPLLEALGCSSVTAQWGAQLPVCSQSRALAATPGGTLQVAEKATLGVAVDPDGTASPSFCEDGQLFGEEYTLVAVADYILRAKPGNTVFQLVLHPCAMDVTRSHGNISYQW